MSKIHYILLKLVKVCVTTDSTALQKSATQSNHIMTTANNSTVGLSKKNLKQVNGNNYYSKTVLKN